MKVNRIFYFWIYFVSATIGNVIKNIFATLIMDKNVIKTDGIVFGIIIVVVILIINNTKLRLEIKFFNYNTQRYKFLCMFCYFSLNHTCYFLYKFSLTYIMNYDFLLELNLYEAMLRIKNSIITAIEKIIINVKSISFSNILSLRANISLIFSANNPLSIPFRALFILLMAGVMSIFLIIAATCEPGTRFTRLCTEKLN